MRLCPLCSHPIPWKILVDGRRRSLQNRKYCLECSPYGAHNTRPLKEPLYGGEPEGDVGGGPPGKVPALPEEDEAAAQTPPDPAPRWTVSDLRV